MRFVHISLSDGRTTRVRVDLIEAIDDAKAPVGTDEELRKGVTWLDPERNADEMSVNAMKRFIQERVRTVVITTTGRFIESCENPDVIEELVGNALIGVL